MYLSDIPNLGTKRLAALKQSGINSVFDLLQNIPRDYLDQRRITRIADIKEEQRVVIIGTIVRSGLIYGKRQRFSATVQDPSGSLDILFFSGVSYWQKRLVRGEKYVVIGKVSDFHGLQMVHPEVQPIQEGEEFSGGIMPIYSISEAMRAVKMDNRFFVRLYKDLFSKNLNLIIHNEKNICPQEIISFLNFSPVLDSLKKLHIPQSFEEMYAAKREIKTLEILPFCLRVVYRRKYLLNCGKARNINRQAVNDALVGLPFSLTGGQAEALEKILEGLSDSRNFHALLQGDVGSGKTVIALLAMLGVCGAGEQAACMAPTDILAKQHFASLESYFKSAGLNLALLVGAMPAAERSLVLENLASGKINAVVGTHALFSESVVFKNLGFAVIDEQHRFGVSQREALLGKGDKPDLLVMSATPIPRSLAMTIYGDLEQIILKEKPPGRKPVNTKLVPHNKRDDMKTYLYKESLAGNRCYFVVSRVQTDEDGETKSVDDVQRELLKFKPDWKVAVVHGQMPEQERDKNLNDFACGNVSLIVCTTVVEVGVNVPEANIMVIDKPESFGLAQLHQLRGRVGRGSAQAWCFLMCDSDNPAYERLAQFASSQDGFEIAEMDLQNRGAGNLEGSAQSGAWCLRWFDWLNDKPLIEKTIKISGDILDDNAKFSVEVKQKIQDWFNQKVLEPLKDGVH